jgi:hypothetical protein
MEHELGIFRSASGTFLGVDAMTVLEEVAKATVEIVGDIVAPPKTAEPCTRIGKVSIFATPVDDRATYYPNVAISEEVAKPAGGRKPAYDSGAWVVQSLIFDNEKFTQAQAQAWFGENEGFVSGDVDTAGTSFRFRQYDPQFFSQFRTKPIATGITAVVGRVKGESDKAGTIADIEAATSVYHGIRAINRAISKNGLRVVSRTEVAKTKDATEERYILGLVLEPTLKADDQIKPDTQRDVYTEETIRAAAHGWMEKHGKIDLTHNWEALKNDQVRVLESYLAPCDLNIGEGEDQRKITKGSWLLALRVLDDAIWADVKAGKIGAFSIGGEATRKPLEGEQDAAA